MRVKILCSAMVVCFVISNFGMVLDNEQNTDGIIAANIETNAGGTTYYVAKDGNDSNSGTESQPWLTIQKAADTIIAGDTVYIKEGIYNERIIPQNSGSPGNYITYTAYPGNTVTIDGNGISLPDWDGLLDIYYVSYINISWLRIANAGPNDNNAGILVYDSHHIVIEENYIYNTVSSGIGVWGSNHIIIDGNEVELACNDGLQECITMAITDTFEIKNNHVHHCGPGTNGGEGIDVKDGSSNGKVYKNHVHNMNRQGIYVDAWDKHTYNIDVFQNVIHDCAASGCNVASEQGGLVENVSIYNNIVYDNDECGIRIAPWSGATERPMRNIKVINNNFYNNGLGVWGGGISVENPDAEDVVIRNNICSQNRLFQIQVVVSIPNLTVDHNLIDGYRGYWEEIYGDDAVIGDPEFVNPPGGDFHLRKDSPAIDNGSSIDAPSDDFDGNKRPYGNGYDIGAFEYQGNDDYNLDCNGILRWANVKPGSVVNGSFTVENVGNQGLEIDWYITEWPAWGTWTFTPISGDNLSPEDGPVTVKVSVVAPDEQNKGFTGGIKIVNKDDINDFCIVPVSLATPKNKQMISTLFIQFLERILEQFPMLERLLNP